MYSRLVINNDAHFDYIYFVNSHVQYIENTRFNNLSFLRFFRVHSRVFFFLYTHFQFALNKYCFQKPRRSQTLPFFCASSPCWRGKEHSGKNITSLSVAPTFPCDISGGGYIQHSLHQERSVTRPCSLTATRQNALRNHIKWKNHFYPQVKSYLSEEAFLSSSLVHGSAARRADSFPQRLGCMKDSNFPLT